MIGIKEQAIKNVEAAAKPVVIHRTSDYSVFKPTASNRYLNQSHVGKLMSSISQHNLLSYNPLMVTPNMEVLDGQHRLEAARKMHLPVSYIIVPDAAVDDVHLLNHNNRRWTMRDFLDFYVARGLKDYADLRDLVDSYGFSTTTGIVLMSGLDSIDKNYRAPSSTRIAFQNGKFEVADAKRAYDMAEKLIDFKPFIKDPRSKMMWSKREWIYAIYRAEQYISHEELLSQFKKSGDFIENAATVKDFLRQIEDIANWGKSTNRIRLY